MTTKTRSRRPKARRSSTSAGARRGRWLVASLGMIIGAVASLGVIVSVWSYWARAETSRPTTFHVDASASSDRIAEELAAAGLVGSARLMSLYLSTLGRFGAVEPGEHLIPANVSPRELSQCLARYPRRVTRDVTIPEGFDHLRVAQRLEQAGICTASGFVRLVREREVLDRLGIRGRDGEGYLFPATYHFAVDSRPEGIFERLVSETRLRMRRLASRLGADPFEQLAARRGWGELEILTMASMIEKEAHRDDERPTIASVFFNRLDDESFRPRRMLQSDPTAAYGCLVLGDTIPSCRGFQQRVLPAMLRDAANPYNSYRHPGLPPGPIASAGEASIAAVLLPAKTDYLYFVAAGDGSHRFSRSLEEHELHVRSGQR